MKVFKTMLALVLLAAVVSIGVWGYPRVAARFTWVAIAAINLSPGMPIRDGMAILKLYQVDKVPEGAMHSLETIIGSYARERITKGEIVRPSAVTDKTPPPVRTMPRWGYSIIGFGVPREDAAKLFVGDRVDVTVTPRALRDGSFIDLDPVGITGWLVHHIDYENLVGGEHVRVMLEAKTEEVRAALPARWSAPSRMVRKTSRDN
ncbi:MAG: SAF domain-containing protein [Thermaerobacter sp.]|nr:SAF domain-containing protein [Thermaerobacter sp.]